MTELTQWLLILGGLLVSVVLVWFIARQVGLLRQAQSDQAARDQRWSRQHEHLVESVRVLARCMLDDQMELSEGCIRVKVLLDTLAPELIQEPRFQIFAQMYESMAHMPTHAARLQTDKRFVRKLDLRRYQLEREHREAILQAARDLLQVRFDPVTGTTLPPLP